jgi:EmrB/QacA subfamily drug resistance transporter
LEDKIDYGVGMGLKLSSGPGRWALAATVLGSSLAMLDATVVNIALPRIGRDLSASLSGLQWILTGYTLALAGLILLGGALGDRYGRRKVFMIGVAWFALASLLCAVAPTTGFLIAARVLQGIGGALLTPGSLAIIQASFDPKDRARAIGAWSGLGGVAAAVGPFVGGWLIQGPGWRWAFLVNVPAAVLVILVALRHVPESRDEDATGSFDFAGAALGAVALTGLTFALIGAGSGDPAFTIVLTAAIGVGTAIAFVLVERRRANPMLPLSVFSSRQFSAVNVVTLVVYAALGGVFFLLSLQLQISAGFSPIAAGAALLPVTILMLLLSARAGALAQRIGPRWPMTAGTAVAAVGVLLMSRIGADSSYLVDVLPAAAIFGLGLSMTVAPLTATVLASADARHAGIASGVNNAVARAAQLFAVAGLPALVGLGGADYEQPAVFSNGFRLAMYVCAGGILAGSVLSLLVVRDDALSPTEARPVVPAPQRRIHCAVDGTPLEGKPAPTTV